MDKFEQQAKDFFVHGFAPGIETEALKALQSELLKEEPNIIQGSTTCPSEGENNRHHPVAATCPVAYCGWISGEKLSTVGEVNDYFETACLEANIRHPIKVDSFNLGASGYFTNWFDDHPFLKVACHTIAGWIDEILQERDHQLAADHAFELSETADLVLA